ncbi:peptidoglycan-binding protein [Buchananella hordeovulneris]|uniref:peptidoglycan-binding domain-containing protein n=1 Tax=Buchananella hordeovulneris TaxID=52770 RepID=UPI000F5EE886|nr:peptidoglycan-binding domain-containing protein [Buchananella hordeovulneris]RRD51762.1 peptidoglycan-binding protein [Buchananella hordeovulneris]
MRRRSLVIAALCLTGALLIMLGTWFAAKRFQSPDQRQAAAAPPTAGPIVVEVTRGDLTEQTTMKATASRAGERSVPLPLPGAVSVLTHPGVAADTELLSGNVIAWINDRPVFALRGPFPLFRDIGEGDSGDDVRLLQQALADLGYDITPDGHFGTYTASLVRDLYETAGAGMGSGATSRVAGSAPAVSYRSRTRLAV